MNSNDKEMEVKNEESPTKVNEIHSINKPEVDEPVSGKGPQPNVPNNSAIDANDAKDANKAHHDIINIHYNKYANKDTKSEGLLDDSQEKKVSYSLFQKICMSLTNLKKRFQMFFYLGLLLFIVILVYLAYSFFK